MAELLRRADFKYIDPNWDPFEYLLQIAKFEEEKTQTNHDHGQSLCKQENMGLKQSFRFNNKYNGGKKTKRSFKEEDGDEEWENGQKPKLTRSKKQKPPCPIPTPDFPDRFKRHIFENMGGSGLVLVIQKSLFFSDVNPAASRFSIPFSQVKTQHFLEKTEADALANQSPMQVCLLDPSMEKTTMTLNRWKMGKTSLYVTTESWNSVVKSNRLKKGDIVQLWAFWVDSKLCFARPTSEDYFF